jgi:hypothetical protein
MMTELTPQEKQLALVAEGAAGSMDEAAHMLVDMGEIDSTTHADLLSPTERGKIYGE